MPSVNPGAQYPRALDYAEFAQEFLGRNPRYRAEFEVAMRAPPGPAGDRVREEMARPWGLAFPVSARARCAHRARALAGQCIALDGRLSAGTPKVARAKLRPDPRSHGLHRTADLRRRALPGDPRARGHASTDAPSRKPAGIAVLHGRTRPVRRSSPCCDRASARIPRFRDRVEYRRCSTTVTVSATAAHATACHSRPAGCRQPATGDHPVHRGGAGLPPLGRPERGLVEGIEPTPPDTAPARRSQGDRGRGLSCAAVGQIVKISGLNGVRRVARLRSNSSRLHRALARTTCEGVGGAL